VYSPDICWYVCSVAATPTVRQVRLVPEAAFQSETDTTTAESAAVVVRPTDGAPVELALLEAPTPFVFRNWRTLNPCWPPAPFETETVIPVLAEVTGAVQM